MIKKRFWFWLSLPIAFVTVILLLYFGSYLICLHTASFGGGGSGQRCPRYVNPLTGRRLPHHLQVRYFFEPAQKIDAFIRPGYWWWIEPSVVNYNRTNQHPNQHSGSSVSQDAANLSNGFYEITNNNPRISIALESGKIVGVGREKKFDIQGATLISQDNWNDIFYLGVDVPYDKSLEKVFWHILVVNGKAYKQDSIGSTMEKKSNFGFKCIPGDQAEDVARFFSIQPYLRKHPGHQLAARFIPQMGEFLQGEDVIVILRIKNVGTNTVVFHQGGRNRAARNNQYVFIARYDGKQVEDIGSSYHLGGLGTLRILKPGDTFKDGINLNKWFSFAQPGRYEVHGSYYLEFNDPADNFPWQTIWEDYISADFTIRINKTSKPSAEQLCKVYGELLEKTKTRDNEHNTEARAAALALSSVRNPIVVPYLIGAMAIPDPIAPEFVVKALEEIGTPEAVKGIIGIGSMKKNMFLKEYGASALGRMKAKEGIPFLIKLLDDNYDRAQISAIQALGQIGTAECLDAIRKKTDNFKGKVKDTAIEVLNKSSPAKGR